MNCLTLNSSAEGSAPLRIESGIQVTGTGDFVNVLISNSLNGHASEKRFAKGITVADLKVLLLCNQVFSFELSLLNRFLTGS